MCWAVFCELLRVFAAVFNSKKYWNIVEVLMGSKKKEKKITLKCHNIKQVSTRVSNW